MSERAFELARAQLLDIVELSEGAVEFLGERSTTAGPELVISLDTSGLSTGPDGIAVRARERFEVVIPSGFPFDHPTVFSVHRRWAGTPHVQYGRLLCLYLAPGVEWNPADGMRGLLTRLSEWIERAVAGTLDPDGQPLHPPAVYGQTASGRIVIRPDLGELVPWAADGTGSSVATLFGWAVVRSGRVDVVDWLDQKSAVDRAFAEDEPVFEGGHPYVVIPAVLIAGQFGSEFPRTAKELSAGLAEHGYRQEQLVWDLSTASLINRRLRRRQVALDASAAGEPWDRWGSSSDGDESPAYDDDVALLTAMLVGTPSRRVEGVARLAHLAAWRLDSLSAQIADVYGSARVNDNTESQTRLEEIAQSWFDSAKVTWMRLMETRPEVTNRRDRGTPAQWLAGKRVLVMGCGALGGPVAEFCARAGVRELTVADHGIVTPGILVRQLFNDADIGRAKATVLAERLSLIRPDLEVVPEVGNVRTTFFTYEDGSDNDAGDGEQVDRLADFDLVIDATATASVRAVVEHTLKRRTMRPHLITMVIGHQATRGLVTTNLDTATGAAVDTFRKVALLSSSGTAGWDDLVDDLFPNPPRTDVFFPEPGCSAPTFVGSAAQTAALAGLMLNEATLVLERHTGATDSAEGLPGAETSFAAAVRLGSASDHLGTSRARWLPDLIEVDSTSGFEIRISAAALAEIRAEVRRGARVRGEEIETGGMLLGAFDDATRIIHVDRCSGPPPDSYLSSTYFQHGLEGSQERITNELERTAGISGFLGFWHTHPGGQAHPSPTDEQGMASIVGPDGTRRRALMMILGDRNPAWAIWRDRDAASRPGVYVRVVPRSAGPIVEGHPGYLGGRDLQKLPDGMYFRGGFGGGARVTAGARRFPRPVSSAPPSRSHPWWRRIGRSS